MKKSLLSVLATTSALVAAAAPSASAAEDTDVTFSLSGGALSVTVAASAALPNGASGATSVSGSLGQTQVTDVRGGTTGWTASAATSVFDNSVPDDPATTEVDESAAATTTATEVSYNSGVPTFTGVVLPTSTGATALSGTPAAVVNGTAVVGNNTAAWNPTLTVTLPSSSTVGDYHGTITTSVL